MPYLPTRQALALTALCACTTPAMAFGDYVMPIDDGKYQIVRCNAEQVILTESDGSVIYPGKGLDTTEGPIVGFCATPTHVFLKTHPLKPRHLFANDTYMETDWSRDDYYIVDKPETLIGPMTEAEFQAQAAVKSSPKVDWMEPRNPHPMSWTETLLLGLVCAPFVILAILVHYWWLALLLGIALFFGIRHFRRTRALKRQAESGVS